MNVADLLKYFPDAVELRRDGDDIVYGDRELYTNCGFMSLEESEILSGLVKPGSAWLEIGSHVGWSTVVLSSAGAEVMAVDPEFGPTAKSGVLSRAKANIKRSNPKRVMTLKGMASIQYFAGCRQKFDGILIDGCHDAPVPLDDAKGADRCLKPGGVIVLHDYKGQPVKDAGEWLASQGFTVESHDTINGLAVCRK